MNQDSVIIGSGPFHRGAFDRALSVAIHLNVINVWDGQQLVVIYDPYRCALDLDRGIEPYVVFETDGSLTVKPFNWEIWPV